ncbi:hypothetical protein EV424DRAFT_1339164, partial [Suillus variegatus]
FPKLKTHSGTKKRWRALSNGKFKRAHAAHAHLNVARDQGVRTHSARRHIPGAQTPTLKKLMPYA